MLDKKEFKATLETRTSKKGSQYEVLVIKITDNIINTPILMYCLIMLIQM